MNRRYRRAQAKAGSAPPQVASSGVPGLFAEALRRHQAGQLPEAERLYRQVLAADSGHADALHLLGVIALQAGQNDVAVELISTAIGINGTAAGYHSNLGVALMDLGRLDAAVAACSAALRIKPDYGEAHYNLGNALKELGRLDAAVAAYGAAIRIKPDYAKAHYNLGNALKELGRLDDAVAAYNAALRIKPDYAEAHSNLGVALMDLGRLDDAVAAYRAAIRIRPDFAAAHSNLGNALQDLGRLDDAVAAHGAALRIKPDFAEAHSNLGFALTELGRLEDAVAACSAAIRIKPDYAKAHNNMGFALTDLGRLKDAVAAYNAALRIKPDYAKAHYNESISRFLLGDLAAGWPKYEWRWRGGSKNLKPRSFSQPQWQGEDIVGRTILLHAEQGLGDSIQFCRYASLVAARAGYVVLEAPRSLLRLLSGLAGVDRLVAAGDPLPDFDYHCPLMSLPGLFGTTVETIPAPIPYLRAEDEALIRWQKRIASSGFKIGIAWQGNPTAPVERGRSAPLACFARLASVPGVRLISLQKAHGLDQLDRLPPGMRVDTLGPDFDDGPDAFIDTAAVVMGLDLIITVDTAIGHLAGALGLPVWLALRAVPHWVWMMDRPDSPWYPNTRLFRQTEPGNWADVFGSMAVRLAEDLDQRRA